MPKETVYGSQLPWGEDYPAVSVVEVSWSREAGHCQIVSKAVNSADHSDIPPPGEHKECCGDSISFTQGMYVSIDRRGINDLIRNLRRARDQAFGRDE